MEFEASLGQIDSVKKKFTKQNFKMYVNTSFTRDSMMIFYTFFFLYLCRVGNWTKDLRQAYYY